MQLLVIGCTFLTLSQCEESTADNRQFSATHLCPSVPSSTPISAAQQCPSLLHISAASSVMPISAQQCRLSVPIIAAYQCCIIRTAYQCCLSLPPHQCPSLLPI
ncbi:unnamed protein product, partial [Staurois parvus]